MGISYHAGIKDSKIKFLLKEKMVDLTKKKK